MTIFYFTATGNCLEAARHIGGNLLSIPQLMRENRFQFKDDAVGLVFPIYCSGLPKMVKRFLEKARWEADYSFAVATYGGNSWATLANLQKLAERRSQHFDYMKSVVTVDNYIPGFEMADELAKLPGKNVAGQLQGITTDIQNRHTNNAAASIGQHMVWYIMQAMAVQLMHRNLAKKYIVNKNCTKCGICAQVCPAGNITITDRVTFGSSCEACLGCVHLCPQNALHLNHERSATRYRNANVSLKEIIDANCQNGAALGTH
jgi:ferredoxin